MLLLRRGMIGGVSRGKGLAREEFAPVPCLLSLSLLLGSYFFPEFLIFCFFVFCMSDKSEMLASWFKLNS